MSEAEDQGARPSPKLLLAGLGVLVLVLGVGLYVVFTGDDGSSCVADAAEHLPEADVASGFLHGGDQERARAAGLDDGGLSGDQESAEELTSALVESGAVLDPPSQSALSRLADPLEQNGYGPDDVSCWVNSGSAFVAKGRFDPEAIAASEAGQDGHLVATSDLVVRESDGDPAALLDQESTIPEGRSRMLEILDDHEAVSFGIVITDPENLPVAVASTYDDGWGLLIVWLFDDTGTREEAEAAVNRILEEGDGTVPDVISGGTDDILTSRGSLLVLQAPLTDPADWATPLRTLDPILYPLDDNA